MVARFGLVATLLATPALACTCSSVEPLKACQLYQKSPIIFRGRVIDDNDDTKGKISGSVLYRFGVVEAFKGLAAGQTQVFIDPASGSSCQTEFSADREYLFYLGGTSNPPAAMTLFGGRSPKAFLSAWKGLEQSPVYVVGVCSPYREVENPEDEDFRYLRSAKSIGPTSAGWIDGRTVQNASSFFYRFAEYAQLPGTGVTLLSASGYRSVTSATADGTFHFGPIAPGVYTITAEHGEFAGQKAEMKTEVPAGGCGVANVSFETKSRVSGKVVDAAGKAVPGVRVELGEPSRDGKVKVVPDSLANTNKRGEFEIRRVPFGNIVLAANLNGAPTKQMPFDPVYAPGTQRLADARILNLKPGSHEKGVVLRLPKSLPVGTLLVEVEWPDGTPARDGARAFAEINGARAAFERAPSGSSLVRLPLALHRKYEVRVDWLNTENRSFDFVEGAGQQIIDFARDGQRVKLRLRSRKP